VPGTSNKIIFGDILYAVTSTVSLMLLSSPGLASYLFAKKLIKDDFPVFDDPKIK
jgi:hypothetical protein